LPRKYRETQAVWFGNRGISWHISVVVHRIAAGELERTFIPIIEECSQDANAVVQVLHHTLKTLKAEHPEILRAVLRQDNAGCYHGMGMLTACLMGVATRIDATRVDFSDPQGGKGPCDGKVTTIKLACDAISPSAMMC